MAAVPLPPITNTKNGKHRQGSIHQNETNKSTEDLYAKLSSAQSQAETQSLLVRIFSLTEPTLPLDSLFHTSPSDLLTVDALKTLEKEFFLLSNKEDGSDSEGITMENFIIAWQDAFLTQFSELELRRLFMKIDAQCTGCITWQDFITYAWTEMKKHDLMRTEGHRVPYPDKLHVRCGHREKDDIVSISVMKISVSQDLKFVENASKESRLFGMRYITLSKNGFLRFFNLKCEPLEVYNLSIYRPKSYYSLIASDMVYMANVKLLAVIFADSRSIQFYRLQYKGSTGYKLLKDYEVRHLPSAPLCVEYIVHPENPDISYLIWGDSEGSICMLKFSMCLSGILFEKKLTKKRFLDFYNLQKIEAGKYPPVSYHRLKRVHDDWVLKVKHCPQISETAFISCCRGNIRSVRLGDVMDFSIAQYCGIKRGVSCFTYCSESHSIYAGCFDGRIRLIKPGLGMRVINTLIGHTKAVTDITLDRNRSLLVSSGEDHRILVYSTSQLTYIQDMDVSPSSILPNPDLLFIFKFDFSHSSLQLGYVYETLDLSTRYLVSALFLNPVNSSLLIATHYLGMFEYRETIDHTGHETLTSHDGSCTQVLYNPLFDLVVSCDVKSTICVWNLLTGAKVIQYLDCHQKMIKGNLRNQEITTMIFDPSYRRLVTGAHDGTVSIWNVSNGYFLRKLDPRSDVVAFKTRNKITGKVYKGADDVSGIVWSAHKERIAVALNSSRKVYVYKDEKEYEDCYEFNTLHESDINCLVNMPPNMVASASSDGVIIIRSIMSGRPFLMFDPAESDKSILTSKIDQEFLQKSIGMSIQSKQANKPLLTASEKMLPFAINRHNRYVSIQGSDEDYSQPGEETPYDYMFDQPRYHHMAFAAALGHDESVILNRTSMKQLNESTLYRASTASNFHTQTSPCSFQKESKRKESLLAGDYKLINNSVDCMIMLMNRENTVNTATLVSAGACGWVRFWSTSIKGGLLAQFNAAHHRGENIVCMTTDVRNEYLITGDSEGYIKVWDIITFCLDNEQKSKIMDSEDFLDRKTRKYSRFAFLDEDMRRQSSGATRRLRLRSQLAAHGLPPLESNLIKTLRSPPLLNSFRGHIRGVTALSYVDHRQLIISSSADGNVRVWTVHGFYVGHFGQSLSWNIDNRVIEKSEKALPHDVRKVASSTTLFVWNGGSFRRWNRLKTICLASGLTSFVSNLAKKPREDHMDEADEADQYADISSVESSSNPGSSSSHQRRMSQAQRPSIQSATQLTKMIKASVANYLHKNKLTFGKESHYKSDEDIENIAISLNPDPSDKKATTQIKILWWKAFMFETMKLQNGSSAEEKHEENKLSPTHEVSEQNIDILATPSAQLDTINQHTGIEEITVPVEDFSHGETTIDEGDLESEVAEEQSIGTSSGEDFTDSDDGDGEEKLTRGASNLTLKADDDDYEPLPSSAHPSANNMSLQYSSTTGTMTHTSNNTIRNSADTGSLYGRSFKVLPTIPSKPDQERAHCRASSEKHQRFKSNFELPNFDEFYNKQVTSKYLGKSYKKVGGHKAFPKLEQLRVYNSKYAVFHTLPFVEVESPKAPTPPKTVEQILERRAARELQQNRTKRYRRKKKLGAVMRNTRLLGRTTSRNSRSPQSSRGDEPLILKSPNIKASTTASASPSQETNICESPDFSLMADFWKTNSDLVVNPAAQFPHQTFPTDFGHVLYENKSVSY